MAAIEQACVPESLVQQCQYFILMHLDEFPINHLTLLPLHVREDLLWKMPLADVCQLESTMFTDGLDMAAYWKHPFDEHEFDTYCWQMPHGDKIRYFYEWGAIEYERAMLYGLLTACAFGSEYLPDGFRFRSPLVKDEELDGLTMLYAVRRPIASYEQCDPQFPSRYSHLVIDPGRELTVDEVVRCFGRQEGELPKIFPGNLSDYCDPDYAHFLSNVVCVSFQCLPLEAGDDCFEFVKAVIQEATNLETLILDQWGDDGCWIWLNGLCNLLSSQTTFLSKFRQLTILSSNSTRFLGFIVSRTNFNQLVTAYLAAPTDHVQKLEFTQTKIKSHGVSDLCSSPTVDQRYLQFKTFEFTGCRFASEYDTTPTAISSWLGQSISKVETPGAWQCFKVDKETNANTRKRKHTAALLEDDCDSTNN